MKVMVYANVGLNLIDGSTIWIQSIVEVLAGMLGCEVIVLSRDALQGKGVIPALEKLGGVRVVSYGEFSETAATHPRPGDSAGIEHIVRKIDADEGLDRIIIRDMDTALTLARVPELRGRVWAYLLESPSFEIDDDRSHLAELSEKAGGLLVQSDTQRGLLEAFFAGAVNKTGVLPPMVKPVSAKPREVSARRKAVRFVYSGKYSADWNVQAFFDIPAACRAAGVEASVSMIGDKVHNEKDDPGFRKRIIDKFKTTPGVTWHGAMDREAAMIESSGNDLGICWRTGALDDSLEISTKFLEFASVGVPSVVNRTAAYEQLLGADYPYFSDTINGVVAAARGVLDDPERHERMRLRCLDLARGFSYEAAATRLRDALGIHPRRTRNGNDRKQKVLVASHDFKFIELALKRLGETGDYEILHDHWYSASTHDETYSRSLLQQADIVFCEWCVGQAVWYSRNKLPHQKLYLRLHRFEAFRPFPHDVVADALDGVMVVSDYFHDICIRDFGWKPERIVVLPQYCVANQLCRVKNPGSEKVLGFVGINGFHHKRFDRALDILRMVRRTDPSYRMRVRSAMPWEFGWIWQDNAEERAKFEALFQRLQSETDLRRAIIFDRPGPDMAEWYRNVGFILSTSESEGCHTSVAEGICSGAVPIVIDWPGARSVYGDAAVFGSVEKMAEAILSVGTQDAKGMADRQAEGARDFDIARTVDHLDGWFSS
jgi:hypothetical protein